MKNPFTRKHTLLAALLCLGSAPAAALYNPPPDSSLAAVQGEWVGTLTYRDYSSPDRMVTLPTRLFVALGSPNQLVLYFVFDDGPSRTVYSYERMQFDFTSSELTWSSMGEEDSPTKCRISEQTQQQPVGRSLTCEQAGEGKVQRYKLVLTADRLAISKEEVDASGKSLLRNQYELARR